MDTNGWALCSEKLPEPYKEKQVWVEGHRGPNWRNNHHLVAYCDSNGEWWEERHPSEEPLPVIAWGELLPPLDWKIK